MSPRRGAAALRGLPLIGVCLAAVAFHSWVAFERAGSIEIRSFPSSVFRMDVFRAPRDWATVLPSGRTSVHPLTKLALTPIGLTIRRHVPGAGSPVDAARVLAIAGVALTTLLAGLLTARLAGGDLRAGALASLLTAVSFSSVLLAAIPESASLAGVATLAPLLFLANRAEKPWTTAESAGWLLLGLLGIAITVTQLAHWGIALLCRWTMLRPASGSPGRAFARLPLLLALVLGLAMAGSWLQAERYPGSRKFYEITAVASDESAFLRLADLRDEPLNHVARVASHFVGVNFVAPFPERSNAFIEEWDANYWILSVESPWRAEWSGAQRALGGVLALLLAAGVVALARRPDPFFAAPLLSIAAMFGLHLLYGHEYLLYAGHWHGLVVAVLVAAAWRAWPGRRGFIAAAIVALSVGVGANSVAVMDRVYAELDYGLQTVRRDAEGRPLIPLGAPRASAVPRRP
ncbi:MAG: hypothetical protein OEP95_04630 [Myxococcales bacterium]|nr:hypothetical protein [Myxococcales bacterium]